MKPGRPTPPDSETLDRFTQIVGQAYALRDEADKLPYLREWRDRFHGEAALILRPGSTGEISGIMKVAHETGTAIVPQCGNTGLAGGQIPFEGGQEIVLSLSRLNHIRVADPDGYTITAEAGCVLQTIQEAAEKVNRLFPLSLAAEGSCQIGGNLATNAGGIGVLAYGTARDLVLGLEVVLADGRVWDGLRSLRKDNTGYDLKQLFIGSEGTLGIITACVLKLFPRPAETVTAIAGLQSLEQAARFFAFAYEAAGRELTAFELLPRTGMEFVLRHGEGCREPLSEPYPWYGLFDVSGQSSGGGAQALCETLLQRAIGQSTIANATVAASLAQAQDFWRLRTLMSEVQKAEGGSIKHDVSVPVARILEFIERANELVETLIPGCRPVPFGHFGDGNIHYNISQPVGMDKASFLDQWDSVNAAVYDVVLSLGGSISAEHGIGRMKRDLLAKVKAPVEMELMRSLKQALDPKGILNPGKVL